MKWTETEKEPHAISNARGWLESIKEDMALFRKAEESGKKVKHDDFDEPVDSDTLREHMEEGPLSVEVSGTWNPGSEAEATDYIILLSTGGPALRLVGDLDGYKQPTSARLEYQDWGTPWTEFPVDGDDEKTLTEYAGLFYFGE